MTAPVQSHGPGTHSTCHHNVPSSLSLPAVPEKAAAESRIQTTFLLDRGRKIAIIGIR